MSLAVVCSRAPASGRAPEVSRSRSSVAPRARVRGFPVRRIPVHLAPADLPKESGRFDLPIALGIPATPEHSAVSSIGVCKTPARMRLWPALMSVVEGRHPTNLNNSGPSRASGASSAVGRERFRGALKLTAFVGLSTSSKNRPDVSASSIGIHYGLSLQSRNSNRTGMKASPLEDAAVKTSRSAAPGPESSQH
jgi:hypothetical protein